MSGINPTIENHVDPWDNQEKYENDKHNIQGLKWNMGKELKNLKDETLKASIKKDLDELQAALTKKDKETIRKERNELSVRTQKGATEFLTAIKNEPNPRIKYNILVSASVQTLLHQHEFLEEKGEQGEKRIDGIWGKKSIAAMKKFQEERNKTHTQPQDRLQVTGFPNSKTIQKLLEWNTNHTAVNTDGEREAISEEESKEITEAKTLLEALSKVEISEYSDDENTSTIASLNAIKTKFKNHIDAESQKKINKIQEKYSIYQKISNLKEYKTDNIPTDMSTAKPDEMSNIKQNVDELSNLVINATHADLTPDNGYSETEKQYITDAETEQASKITAFSTAKKDYEDYWNDKLNDNSSDIGNLKDAMAKIQKAWNNTKKEATENAYYLADDKIKGKSLDELLNMNPLPEIKQKQKGFDKTITYTVNHNNQVIKDIINYSEYGSLPQYYTLFVMLKNGEEINKDKILYGSTGTSEWTE